MIDELLKDSNYLIPYFKQFISTINSKNILDFSNERGTIYDNLIALDCIVKNISEINNNKFDGIIINNLDYELDRSTMKYLFNILSDNGCIFIILHLRKVDYCFDEEVIPKEIEALYQNIENIFEIKTEFIGDSSWKFLIIEKKYY